MRLNMSEILALRDSLQGEHQQHLTQWESIAALMFPARLGMISRRAEGDTKTDKQHDSLGMELLDDLAHYLGSVQTPQGVMWLGLYFKDDEINQNDSAREWLDDCQHRVYKYIEDSNFYAAAAEFYRDISAFGTACFECNPRKDMLGRVTGLAFSTPHLRSMVGLEDAYSSVETTIRVWEGIPSQFIELFGNAAGREIHEHAVKAPETTYQFVHAIYPRDANRIDPKAFGLKEVPDDRLPFESVWINETERLEVKRSGYYEKPRVMARWDTNTDSKFAGYGPGMRARPGLNEINEWNRLEREAFEKEIDPPTVELQNAVIGTVKRQAGGRNVVTDPNGLDVLKSGTTWQPVFAKREDMEQSVRRIMFSDLIREPMDTHSGTTAYEVAQRMQRAQRILGEAVGRMKREWLSKVVERAFSILARNGMLLPAPPVVANLGADFDVRLSSPLQVAQQTGGLEGLRMFMADIGYAAAIQNPQEPGKAPIMDVVDFDGYGYESAERHNAPASITRDKAQVEKLRQKREERQEEMEELAKGKEAAEMVGKLGGPEVAAQLVQGAGRG